MKGHNHNPGGAKGKKGHSFPSKAGFTGSTGRSQSVRGYTRRVPKARFATGGVVKMADPGSSVVRRTHPVTGFDAQHGGKGPLRPGFKEGGKVGGVGAAIKMVKALMARGESAESAAKKAASRYGVSKAQVAPAGVAPGGGGLPADKQMLARGGMAGALGQTVGRAMRSKVGMANPRAMPIKTAPGKGSAFMSRARAAMPAKSPAPVTAPTRTTGYGSFGRNPLIGR